MIIDLKTPLDAATQKGIDVHNRNCTEYNAAKAELFADYIAAARSAHKLPIAECDAPFDKLDRLLDELDAQRATIDWDRYNALAQIEKSMIAAVDDQKAGYERVVQYCIDDLDARGVDLNSFGNGANPEAAGIQLRAKAQQREECLQAMGRVNVAEAELAGVRGQRNAPPQSGGARLEWPALPADVHPLVAKLLSFRKRQLPRVEESSIAARIKRDLDLTEAALLPAHEKIVAQLVPFAALTYRPFQNIKPQALEKVKAIVANLPQTPGVRKFMARSAERVLI